MHPAAAEVCFRCGIRIFPQRQKFVTAATYEFFRCGISKIPERYIKIRNESQLILVADYMSLCYVDVLIVADGTLLNERLSRR